MTRINFRRLVGTQLGFADSVIKLPYAVGPRP
jgi:hypothetical protein